MTRAELRQNIRQLFDQQTDYVKAHDPLVDQAMLAVDSYLKEEVEQATKYWISKLYSEAFEKWLKQVASYSPHDKAYVLSESAIQEARGKSLVDGTLDNPEVFCALRNSADRLTPPAQQEKCICPKPLPERTKSYISQHRSNCPIWISENKEWAAHHLENGGDNAST